MKCLLSVKNRLSYETRMRIVSHAGTATTCIVPDARRPWLGSCSGLQVRLRSIDCSLSRHRPGSADLSCSALHILAMLERESDQLEQRLASLLHESRCVFAQALTLSRAIIGRLFLFTVSAMRLCALSVIPRLLVTGAHQVFYRQEARKERNSGVCHAVLSEV